MATWTRETASAALKENGLAFEARDITNGVQFRLPEGTPIDLYESTGKVVVRGKDSDEKVLAQKIFNRGVTPTPLAAKMATAAVPAQNDDRVFVVYGHDTASRDALELMLLRMNLKPVILNNMAPEGKTIIEALMANTNVKYAVVLLTPDDEGHKAGHSDEKKFRARQNVVLELGMFLTALGRERVAILHKGDLELPSDINGLIYIAFQKSVQEAKNKLAASLQKAGFFIDINSLSAE
jgi:predicted nucleotide-binding protein